MFRNFAYTVGGDSGQFETVVGIEIPQLLVHSDNNRIHIGIYDYYRNL